MARVPPGAVAFGIALAVLAVGPLVAAGEDVVWTTTDPDPNPVAWDEARLEPGTEAYDEFVNASHQSDRQCTSYGSVEGGGSLSPPSGCSQVVFTSPGGGGGSPGSPGGDDAGGSPGGTGGGGGVGSPGGGGTTDDGPTDGGAGGDAAPGPGAALTLVAFVVLAVIARREAR